MDEFDRTFSIAIDELNRGFSIAIDELITAFSIGSGVFGLLFVATLVLASIAFIKSCSLEYGSGMKCKRCLALVKNCECKPEPW